tara:strand:+ start:8000 stop:8578 length:579 start_codon:yes stop_codon:yes gene_type:complete
MSEENQITSENLPEAEGTDEKLDHANSPSEDQRKDEVDSSSSQDTGDSHLFAVRTTGGQEKVVLRLLESKMRSGDIHVQSILLVDNLKGYVVVEAHDPQDMFAAIQGVRHVKGQLRGELQFSEIENYLVKKSTVSELAVDGTVEVIGGPFKGMKATITRVDHDKEEATVILLDAPYQLPVTVDANYLKPVSS